MKDSACELNKQGDNMELCHTPIPIVNQSVIPRWFCCFLTHIQVSQETSKVVWYSHFLKNFPQFVVVHTVKSFSLVSEAEVGLFLEFPCFLHDSVNVDSLISASSAYLNLASTAEA